MKPMRRQDKEITDKKIIVEILEMSQICRLGLVENGEAYIVPTNFAYDDGIIYIHSAAEGRKIDIIRRDNRVSFEMESSGEVVKGETPCKWGMKYRSIMGRGFITIHDDIELKTKGLNLIMKKYGGSPDMGYDESSISRVVLLKLKIESVTAKQSGIWE